VIVNVADGIGAASAGFLADGVDAGLLQGTVAISSALDSQDRGHDLASATPTADITARTDADHRPYGVARKDLAGRRLVAWLYDRAGVLASVVQTGQGIRTVTILTALGLQFGLARDVRIAAATIKPLVLFIFHFSFNISIIILRLKIFFQTIHSDFRTVKLLAHLLISVSLFALHPFQHIHTRARIYIHIYIYIYIYIYIFEIRIFTKVQQCISHDQCT
jgi:hypothetical protein